MVDEINAAAIIGDKQFEDDHPDHVNLTKKQILDQRLLEIKSLVCAVVHDNSNRRARLAGLELNKSFVNVLAVEKTVVPTAITHPYACTSA